MKNQKVSWTTNRLLVGVVTGVALSLVMTTAQAAGKGKKTRNTTADDIGFEVVGDDCRVLFSSNKDISNIVIAYDDGTQIKYPVPEDPDAPPQNTYEIAGAMFDRATGVYVKSGNNGNRGKRNSGIGAELDGFHQLQEDLTHCQQQAQKECTFGTRDCATTCSIRHVLDADIDKITNVLGFNEITKITDTTSNCEIMFSQDMTGNGGVSIRTIQNDVYNTLINFSNKFLTPTDAQACAFYLGCDEYGNVTN